MGLPRDFVELEQALRRSGNVDLFAPMERSGLPESPEANAMLERLRAVDFHDPIRTMRLCLQALRVQHDEMAPRLIHAELVATLPPEMPGVARTTGQVLLEMLRPPIDEVIILGYELTDQYMMRLIAESAANGADVIMICDRARGSAQRLLEIWPTSPFMGCTGTSRLECAYLVR